MQHAVDEEGEYTFTKEVEVEEGKDYQYKFRVGEGDWWLLNEAEPTGKYPLYDATFKRIRPISHPLLTLQTQQLIALAIEITSSPSQSTKRRLQSLKKQKT